MTEEQKRTAHGGKREGAGRKPAGTEDVKIRLTPDQHQKLSNLGGSVYLQKHLDKLLPNTVLTVNLTQRQQWLVAALDDSWFQIERNKLHDYNSLRHTDYIIKDNELTIFNESEEGVNFSLTYQAENVPVNDKIDEDDLNEDDFDDEDYEDKDEEEGVYRTKEEAIDYLDSWIAQQSLSEAAVEDLQHMKDLILAHQGVTRMTEAEWFANALKELEQESRLPIFFFELTPKTCHLVDMLDIGHALNKYALTYKELYSFVKKRAIPTSNDGTERIVISSPAEALQFALENRDKFSDDGFYRTQRRIFAWLDNNSAV